MGKINSIELSKFINDFKERSKIIVLEEGSEKDEIFRVAKNKGILLKDSTDLAGFKTIYAFTDKANSNGAILPEAELLRALPTVIGKPVNIDHIRNLVVGYYIDYKYIKKSKTVIVYGIFFKSNFADYWEEAKRLFAEGKLATSFEIWSPKNKRKFNDDGTYELYDMEIAGGALIYKEKPAFEDAKVLELAKKKDFTCVSLACDLIKPVKEYNDKELIVLDIGNVNSFVLTCPNCGNKFEVSPGKEFYICPICSTVMDKSGQRIADKEQIESGVSCPSCRNKNWLILSSEDKQDKVKCLSCGKEYIFVYSELSNDIGDYVDLLLEGSVNCVGCNKQIKYFYSSSDRTKEIQCRYCGLKFEIDIPKRPSKIKKLQKILKNGGLVMAKKEIEITKFHRYVDMEQVDFDKFVEELLQDVEGDLEEAKKLTYQERKSLPDDAFAVIIRVKNKRTGGTRKIRMFPIHDEAHVRNALARLNQEKVQKTLKRYKISKTKLLKKILKRAKELNMIELLLRHKDDCKKLGISCPRMEKATDRKKVAETIKALRKKNQELKMAMEEKIDALIKEYEEKMKKLEEEFNKKVEMYKEHAKTIIERRNLLGEYAKDMTDEQVLDDKEFEIAKLRKENDELKKKTMETSSTMVSKPADKDKDIEKIRKKIDEMAFGA